MRRKLIVVALLAAASYAVYAFMLRPPEKRACRRIADLCGLQREGSVDRCVSALDAVKDANPGAVDKVTSCVADAKSCGEAAGCASGMALGIGAGFVGDFLSGVKKSLE